MKRLLTALPFLLLLVTSCQKEISFDSPADPNGGSGGGTSGDLLVKVVAVTGSETLTTLYTYDSQKRLETETMDGSTGGLTMHNYRKFIRDASGRVSRILQKLDQNGIASDTSVNNIHYPNATTMEYDYSLTTISLGGFSAIDSSVYSFSGGKLLNTVSYLSTPLLGLPPIVSTKYEFTYDASGRVSILKIYATLSPTGIGSLTPIVNETFTYGSSVNYLWSTNNGAQNYWLTGMPNAVNNAVTKLQIDDLTDPSNSTTINSTYVLGAGGKPTSAKVTVTNASGPGQVTNYTFFYQ